MPKPKELRIAPAAHIIHSILVLRDRRVLLSHDLAELYAVETRALNQAVRRNLERFPDDFMFPLSRDEIRDISQFVICSDVKHSRNIYAFTEQGVAMLSSVLSSPRAVRVNIEIMRAFVRMRQVLASNQDLAKRLDEIEARLKQGLGAHDQKLDSHEQAIVGIFKTLRELMHPPQTRAIGFTADLGKQP